MLLLGFVSAIFPKNRPIKRFMKGGNMSDGLKAIDIMVTRIDVFDRSIKHSDLKSQILQWQFRHRRSLFWQKVPESQYF